MRSTGFWNLPNSLTVLRIALIPVMVWLLKEEPTNTEEIVSLVIFIGAMITDIIDGWLARKWDLVSPVGAYLDPLADKLMTITVLVMLVPLGLRSSMDRRIAAVQRGRHHRSAKYCEPGRNGARCPLAR